MPRLTGPLFSLDARQTLAKTIVYSAWKGLNYARIRVIPYNPKSAAQQGVRTSLTYGVQYWRKDLSAFRENIESVKKTGNATVWLEYFAKGVATQLENVAQELASPRFDAILAQSFWDLNDRQKEILSLLEEPNSNITNKKVRKLFKISQITASRDLAKLAVLGLLFAHGKGRSVSYTKV